MRLFVILIAAGICPGAPGASPVFEPIVPGVHSERLVGSYGSYRVVVGGTVDMDNTLTKTFDGIGVAFQNNESLTIANTGQTPVVNPRVVANDQRRWWSLETLLDEILAGAVDDQEKALLIYDFVRLNTYHDYPVFTGDELHDPVRYLNEFGAGFCDDAAYVGCSLLYHAGLNHAKFGRNPRVRRLYGHMMCEAVVGDGFQFLDIDQQTFYLDLENERPVSGDAVAYDHYLAKREQAFGPEFKSWTVGESAAAFFGRDDSPTFQVTAGHRIEYVLRPGEQLVYRWDNIGKLPAGVDQSKLTRKYWGNSLWVFEPRLTEERLRADAVEFSGGHVVFEMTTPYALCGGRVVAAFDDKTGGEGLLIAVSIDSLNWSVAWRGDAEDRTSCRVDLDTQLRDEAVAPRYSYFVKVEAPLASIKRLRFETDLMVSPFSLPRLRAGRNVVTYGDESPEPHEITVTHRWRESAAILPPTPPGRPDFPRNYESVCKPTIPFAWPAVADADLYHLQVSRRPDMRLAYRPSFDVLLETNRHHSPFPGLFNPDEDYFWRVKARNAAGVWGEWSAVWSFRWEGPRVPVDLIAQIEGEEISIAWQPHPRGPPPAHYEIYGSDERGFTPSKTRHGVLGLGEQPANFLGVTDGHCYRVVAEGATRQAMNRSFYRVVAVDQNGVAGGPSELLELPHPFIFSSPVTVAQVDAPYRYQVHTLTSRGDLQKRYAQPVFDYWEREGYAYDLAAGPTWLAIEATTGVLTGLPTAADRGAHPVTIVCRRTYPFEQGPDEPKAVFFQKDGDQFQAEHRQTFELVVE